MSTRAVKGLSWELSRCWRRLVFGIIWAIYGANKAIALKRLKEHIIRVCLRAETVRLYLIIWRYSTSQQVSILNIFPMALHCS
mmetsp:Transcript_7349/g.18010  ORF Transcript_7349/g.18010 Transcript_7349/m.18010 type:complete len:83 (-) Transcript_7349:964-1212(-)